MLGLEYNSILLNIIDDYNSLSTDKRWVVSAFGGILMCKLVSFCCIFCLILHLFSEYVLLSTFVMIEIFVGVYCIEVLSWNADRVVVHIHVLNRVFRWFMIICLVFNKQFGLGLFQSAY